MLSFRQYLLETIEDIPHSSIPYQLHKEKSWFYRNQDKVNRVDHSKFEDNEKNSVRTYSSSFYRDINKYLRQKLNGDERAGPLVLAGTNNTIDNHVKNISSALNKARLNKDIWLHHGMKGEPTNNEKKARGFMSTTIRPSTTYMFTDTSSNDTEYANINRQYEYYKHLKDKTIHRVTKNSDSHIELTKNPEYRRCHVSHILHFHAPKGSRALFLGPSITLHDHENEVLLHHGAHVKIHKTPTASISKSPFNDDHVYVHWYGKLVHDGIEPTRHAKGDK